MLKLRNKISKFSSYLLLFCYITIVVANTFHHHNIDLKISNNLKDQNEEKQKSHIFFNGSEAVCLVHHAYNSINNTITEICESDKKIQNESDTLDSSADTEKIVHKNTLNYSLRAPPLFIS